MRNRINDDNFLNSLMACVICIMATMIGVAIGNHFLYQQAEKNYAEMMDRMAAYIATATDSEYEKIAQKIRHDFIFFHWDEKAREIVQFLPNTARKCPTCRSDYSEQAYIIANNNGEFYALDLEDKFSDMLGTHASLTSAGYEEISKSTLYITHNLFDSSCQTFLHQGEEILSVQRMKKVFCDECIEKILSTLDGQYITTFSIFIPQEQKFYSINNELNIQIDDYTLIARLEYENAYIDYCL